MKHFACLVAVLIGCASAKAPCRAQDYTQPPASVATDSQQARQQNTDQLALVLYGTHLDDGSWTRHDFAPCSRLAHHRFAFFTQTPTDGAIARFLAVYDLDATPSHTAKPWHRGILLARLRPLPVKGLVTGPVDPVLLAVFNRVLQDEHVAGHHVPPAARINIDALADCFLVAADEHRIPVISSELPQASPALPVPVVGGPVTGIMIPLVSPAGYTRSANLRLDSLGLLTTADILVQYTAR